jgi:hypothetical protein
VLEYIGQLCAIPTNKVRNITPITPFRIPLLVVILNLVTHMDDSELIIHTGKEMHTIVDKYVTVARRLMDGQPEGIFHRVHRAIQQQLLAQIFRIDLLSGSAGNDFNKLVGLLLQISSCKPLALASEERSNFIFILTRIYKRMPWFIVTESLRNGLQVMNEASGGLEDQFVTVIRVFDDYLASDDTLTKEGYESLSSVLGNLMWTGRQMGDLGSLRDRSSVWDQLSHIKDPWLAWWLLEWSPKDWQSQSLIRPDFRLLEDRVDILAFPINWSPYESLPHSAVTFVRTLIIDGSPKMQDMAIHILGNHVDHLISEFLTPKVSNPFSP